MISLVNLAYFFEFLDSARKIFLFKVTPSQYDPSGHIPRVVLKTLDAEIYCPLDVAVLTVFISETRKSPQPGVVVDPVFQGLDRKLGRSGTHLFLQ